METNPVKKKLYHGTNSDESDRISNLPDSIKQHILSFVNTREAVRTSILSSSWRALSESLPTIDFPWSCFFSSAMNDPLPDCDDKDDAHKAKRELILRVRRSFYAFLDRALGSQMDMDKLHLCFQGFDLELISCMDGWLAGVVRRRVKELRLEFGYSVSDPRYSFPKSVFLPKGIKRLRLVNCGLSSSCLVDGQLPRLQEIHLQDVSADDVFLANLLASCPNLENLTLRSCSGLTRLEIFCLFKLKTMVFEHYEKEMKVITIEAPNLCEFYFTFNGRFESKFNIGACKNLEVLVLYGYQLDDYGLADILNNHLMLKRLSLNRCHTLHQTVVSSQSLVEFICFRCKALTKVIIDAPNLKFFLHDGIDPTTFVCKGPNFKLRYASIHLIPKNREKVWFNGLLKFLAKLCWTESLSLCVYNKKDVIIPETLRMKRHPPLYSVKHLKIEFRYSTLKHLVEVIQSLLWLAPCPETISISRSPLKKKLKFTYEKPLKGKKKCGCWKYLSVNCWKHSLVKVLIESTRGLEDDDTELANFFRKERNDVKIECFSESTCDSEW
ncbi:unnamed protein product [Cuscuta campestris]|uniref:F-box domain-containing protein n=1 Tax=Cuscuta campestris TaxID=132261 RepID=A0A484MQE8_9ASTE|nr:unnamed protein product [Cuscuta campestris]VFQ90396.1 unnamed protein product [Cuscuta campestris]